MLFAMNYCLGLANGIKVMTKMYIRKKTLLMLGVRASRTKIKIRRSRKLEANGLLEDAIYCL